MRSAVNSHIWTIPLDFAFSNFVPVMGETGGSRKDSGPYQVLWYWCHTLHICPHSPPIIHFTFSLFASAYIFEWSLFAISFEVKKPKFPLSEANVLNVMSSPSSWNNTMYPMNVILPFGSKYSPEGFTKRISAPFLLYQKSTSTPV